MDHRSALVAVASAQLAAQLGGHVVALHRGRHVDVPFLSGSPEHLDLVRQLEEQVDSIDTGQISEMSGDELAAEFEKFLRDQGS